MRPSLLPEVQEVVCLPLHYRDSSGVEGIFGPGKKLVYVDAERFMETYHIIVAPVIIAVDRHGFISAIQYAYSEGFSRYLIQAVTKYDVGPSIPKLHKK